MEPGYEHEEEGRNEGRKEGGDVHVDVSITCTEEGVN